MSTPSDPRSAVQAKYRTGFLGIGVSTLITSYVLAILQFATAAFFPKDVFTVVPLGFFWLTVCVLSGCLFILICSTNYDSVTKTARAMRIGWIVANCFTGLGMVGLIILVLAQYLLTTPDADGKQIPMIVSPGGKENGVVLMLAFVAIFVCGIVVVIRLEKYVDELERSKPAMDPEYGATADVFNDPNMQYYDPNMQQNQPTMQQNQPNMPQNQPNMPQQQ